MDQGNQPDFFANTLAQRPDLESFHKAKSCLNAVFGTCQWRAQRLGEKSYRTVFEVPLTAFCRREEGGRRWIEPTYILQELMGFGLKVEHHANPARGTKAEFLDGTLEIEDSEVLAAFADPEARKVRDRTLEDFLLNLKVQREAGVTHMSALQARRPSQRMQGR